ncbi:MAG: inorganic phosphate transporter [Campylobacterota bacterium]|nr:inorganic phosphate transporter [Campylobacterota bacterium]
MIKTIPKLSLFFGFLLAAMTIYFLYWGLGYTNSNHVTIFVLATIFGIFMAFNIGGNDVANSFGTSVGAKTLTIPQALAIAAVFEVSGAMIAGGAVTDTIRKGIVDLSSVEIDPMQFVYIMMSALLAAAIWLLFATKKGYPVSTTHSIIGGIVGSSITLGVVLNGAGSAFGLVQWDKIVMIAMSWVVSPVLGGLVSYALYSMIKKHVLNFNDKAHSNLQKIKKEKKAYKKEHKVNFETLSKDEQRAYTDALARDAHVKDDDDFDIEDFETDYHKKLHGLDEKKENLDAHKALQTYVPIIAAIGSVVISAMLIFKGLKNVDLEFSTLNKILIMMMIASAVWMATYILAKTLKGKSLEKSTFLMFSWMQVFTASGFAFSHGSNDIANAIGPFAAILDVLRTGEIGASAAVPPVAMLTFGVALIAGLWFIGKEVIQTVGTNLTKMHPASGFSAELAAAGVVLIASMFGIPVSSTHILIGAVLGIGLVNHEANWGLMKPIALAWVITLPAAAILSSITFLALSNIF